MANSVTFTDLALEYLRVKSQNDLTESSRKNLTTALSSFILPEIGHLKAAGITRRIRMYDFRHAAITNMLSSGADLKSVSEIAGHSRTDTTTKIYQHTKLDLLRKQINLLPNLSPTKSNTDVVDFQSVRNQKEKQSWGPKLGPQKKVRKKIIKTVS